MVFSLNCMHGAPLSLVCLLQPLSIWQIVVLEMRPDDLFQSEESADQEEDPHQIYRVTDSKAGQPPT